MTVPGLMDTAPGRTISQEACNERPPERRCPAVGKRRASRARQTRMHPSHRRIDNPCADRGVVLVAAAPRLGARLLARHLVDVGPALDEVTADVVHAGVEPVVRVLNIGEHLLGVPAVGGGEGLVPLREDERLGVGRRVLARGQFTVSAGSDNADRA